ncbi:MAG TPA: hypothetical protein PK010_00455 [Alphaproteobacteria bacterium]|nr:hypothetical protein [Alphaproteobacteria bacterium]
MILLGIALSGATFWLSYKKAAYDVAYQNQAYLLKTKTDVEKALRTYTRFINLTVFRLGRAKPKTFPSILASTRHYKVDPFPTIEKMTFEAKKMTPKEIISLANGRFQEKHIVYDARQKPLGTLTVVFLLQALLKNMDSQNVFSIKSKGSQYHLSFELPDFPYVFVLTPTPFSIWSYALASPFYLLVVFSLGTTCLLTGGLIGIVATQNFLKKARHIHKNLTKHLSLLQSQHETSHRELQNALSLVTLHEEAAFKKQELTEKIQHCLREMAHKVYAIHEVLYKLLSQDFESPAIIQDIRILIQENNLILKQLVRGHPIGSPSETLDVRMLLTSMQTIFQPEIVSKNTNIHINAKPEVLLYANKLALEIVLYNIFVHLIDRLTQDNTLEIAFYEDEKKGFHINYYDDGYVMRHKKGSVREKEDYSLLQLTQEGLSDFTRHLGWKIEWTQEKKGTNGIKFFIPLPMPQTEKIIRLADFKEGL